MLVGSKQEFPKTAVPLTSKKTILATIASFRRDPEEVKGMLLERRDGQAKEAATKPRKAERAPQMAVSKKDGSCLWVSL